MKKKFVSVLCAAACAGMALCACSPEKEENVFTGETANEPAYQANLDAITPSAYRDVEGLDLEPGTYISVIGKEENSSYWKQIRAGVEQAAADLNEALGYRGDDQIKVLYNAPADGENIDEQVNILDEELARYPDVIAIASIDQDASGVQFDLAAENGIPIVAFDSGNVYQEIQCTCRTDNSQATAAGASKLCEAVGDSGEVALIVHDSVSDSAKEAEGQQTAEEGQDTEQSDETAAVMDEINSIADSMSDEDAVAYCLSKHPDLKGCFGTNVNATQLGLKALKNMDKIDDVVLMGFDAGAEQIEALQSGEIDGLVVQNPFGIGYAAVVASARTVLEIGNEAEVNTGYVWVDQENMEEKSVQAMLYE